MKNNGNVKILSMLLALMMFVLPINPMFADYENVSTSTLNEYEDSSHSVEIPGNPVTTIIKQMEPENDRCVRKEADMLLEKIN